MADVTRSLGSQQVALMPWPQQIEWRGEGPASDEPVQHQWVSTVPAEGYELEVSPEGISLRHSDDNGRRYGSATLGQLRAQCAGRLPGVFIRDWPDFPVRGFMLDVSRDRVPTRETLERFVELMALVRLNQLQLYTEHTFAYRDHEVVWRHASPITPDDVQWLDQLCQDNGIELVANQNCFGHMGRWLRHSPYRHRAETPDGFELLSGVKRSASLLAPTADNAAFALGLLDELLPNFTSRRVNIGCDEPFELGRGASRDEVARRGREAVYFEHLLRLIGPLADQGYEVQFFADVVRDAPELLGALPDAAVPLAWTYEAPVGQGRKPPPVRPEAADDLARAGIDLEAHRGFAAQVAPLAEAGAPFWVVPGTSSWNSLIGRIDNAVGNLRDAAEVGTAHGATGYLITDWGDNGHFQPPSISFGPLLFGGAVSWSLSGNRDLDLPAMLDRYVFDDTSQRLGGALEVLGRAWRGTGQRAFNGSPLQAALVPEQHHHVVGDPDPARVRRLVDQLDEAIVAVESSEPGCADGEVVRRELANAARLARHGALRLLDQASPEDLVGTVDEYAECWLARSRPGGLKDSVAYLSH